MEREIRTPISNGRFLTAWFNDDPAFDRELYVGITNESGAWIQDLAVIRNPYTYDRTHHDIIDDDLEVKWDEGKYEVLVFSDKDNEDYTHEFLIDAIGVDEHIGWDEEIKSNEANQSAEPEEAVEDEDITMYDLFTGKVSVNRFFARLEEFQKNGR